MIAVSKSYDIGHEYINIYIRIILMYLNFADNNVLLPCVIL